MSRLFDFLNVDKQDLNEKTKIIVCEDNVKKAILKFNYENKIIENIKIISEKELVKLVLLDVDRIKASLYIVENNYASQEEVDDVLKALTNIEINNNIEDERIFKLASLKKELIDNGIIALPPLQDKINKYQIIIIGQLLNKKLNEIVKAKEDTIIISKEVNNKEISIKNFLTIQEETYYVVDQIIKLLENGIDIEDIKVYYESTEYALLLKLYLSIYNIDIETSNQKKLFSFKVVKQMINDLKEGNFDGNDKYFHANNNDVVNQTIDVLNKFLYLTNDFSKIEGLLINELKRTNFKSSKKNKEIKLIDLSKEQLNLNDNYIFVLGFNQNIIPVIKKDNDYLSDKLKTSIKFYTSLEMNKIIEKNILVNITNMENISISYSINHLSKSYQISNIIKNFKVKEKNISDNISYIKELNKILFSKAKEDMIKYNHKSLNYNKHLELNDNDKYINDYQKIQKKYEVNEISSSKLETFFGCSYKYYLKYILYMKKNTNDNVLLGNFFHYILENIIKLNIEIEKIADFVTLKTDDFIRENEERLKLTHSQKYYLHKQKKDLVFILENLFSEFKIRNFNDDIITELEMEKKLDNNTLLKGKADLILERVSNDDLFIEIYDYKTGDISNDIDLVEFGFNMQNLIYYILLKEYYKGENFYLYGFYKHKIKASLLKDDEALFDKLEINGYSDDKETVKFKRKVKKLSDIDLDDMEKKVLENIEFMQNEVEKQNFSINPKIINKKNKACTYCEYYEMCNKTNANYVYINK